MDVKSVYSSLHKIADAYRLKLTSIPDVQFKQTPPVGGWSYSEVYSHIWDASLLSLEPIKNCIKGVGKNEPTKLIPRLILFFGSLPPGRYKVPKRIESRVKKITKRDAEELIDQFLIELEIDYNQIVNASPEIKNQHPRLGYFNASQWLRFIEIHLKHHYKQLQRIEKSI
jgi:hypothetical protein